MIYQFSDVGFLHLDLTSHQETTTITKPKGNLVLHWPVHLLSHRNRGWEEEDRERAQVSLQLLGPLWCFFSSSSIQLKLRKTKLKASVSIAQWACSWETRGCGVFVISNITTIYSGWVVLWGKRPTWLSSQCRWDLRDLPSMLQPDIFNPGFVCLQGFQLQSQQLSADPEP